MSESNAVPTPSSSTRSNESLDVIQQMIALCQRDIETLAQSLDHATGRSDIDQAAQAVREIQAGALLHGLDDTAILATEVEHALGLNNDEPTIWQEPANDWSLIADRIQKPPDKPHDTEADSAGRG